MDEINDITVNKQSKAKEPFGRPVGTGKYSESTSVIRVPNTQKPVMLNFLEAYEKSRKRNTDLDESFYTELESLHIAFNEKLSLPLGGAKLDAGFGNMIEDWMEDELVIKDYLVDDKEMSFLKIIGGLSMNLAGLLPGAGGVVCESLGFDYRKAKLPLVRNF